MILVQSKQAEIEKFVEGMGYSLQLRAGVKQGASVAAHAGPAREGSLHRSGSIGEAPPRTDKDRAIGASTEAKVGYIAYFEFRDRVGGPYNAKFHCAIIFLRLIRAPPRM